MSLEQLMALARQLSMQAPLPRAAWGAAPSATALPRSAALSPEEWAGLFAEPAPSVRQAPPA